MTHGATKESGFGRIAGDRLEWMVVNDKAKVQSTPRACPSCRPSLLAGVRA